MYLSTKECPASVRILLERINEAASREIRIMEVCGTHTVAIFRHGVRSLLPTNITLLSGPGCPVCVTAQREIDTFIAAASLDNVIIATFGDLLKVPGTGTSLQRERALGRQVKIVYSVLDALELAKKHSDKEIIFLGVGFETTTPTIAAAIMEAKRTGMGNFSILSAHKLVPPALDALMASSDANIHGFLCPGHVSVVIGSDVYIKLVEQYNIPCVVAGFEPTDILEAIAMLTSQVARGDARVENQYRRAVTAKGNEKAMQTMFKVFEPCDAEWRGIGVIPLSGLKIKEEFLLFDAIKKFEISVSDSKPPAGCLCGDILKGIKTPSECPLYKRQCTPIDPVGPCMVSTEGTCAAYYKYQDSDTRI
ncbi:MAG: hydrogenase formation protein HypD [Pseudomonadota bacterium]